MNRHSVNSYDIEAQKQIIQSPDGLLARNCGQIDIFTFVARSEIYFWCGLRYIASRLN